MAPNGDSDAKHEEAQVGFAAVPVSRIAWGACVCGWQWPASSLPEKPPPSSSPVRTVFDPSLVSRG
jgi:hypothetical protein